MLKYVSRFVGGMGIVAVFLGICRPLVADILIVGSTEIRAIDTDTGQEIHQLKLGEVVTDLAFSPDGLTIYVASAGGKKTTAGGVIEVDAASIECLPTCTTTEQKLGATLLCVRSGTANGIREARHSSLRQDFMQRVSVLQNILLEHLRSRFGRVAMTIGVAAQFMLSFEHLRHV